VVPKRNIHSYCPGLCLKVLKKITVIPGKVLNLGLPECDAATFIYQLVKFDIEDVSRYGRVEHNSTYVYPWH
jgi:hypothetical protein